MKTFLWIVVVIIILALLAFIPVWNKPVKTGTIKINTYTEIMVATGHVYID